MHLTLFINQLDVYNTDVHSVRHTMEYKKLDRYNVNVSSPVYQATIQANIVYLEWLVPKLQSFVTSISWC
jgi:hypothetical protein